MRELCDAGRTVLVETSGEADVSRVDPRVHKIMDLKAPGSGESHRNRWSNLEHIDAARRDQVRPRRPRRLRVDARRHPRADARRASASRSSRRRSGASSRRRIRGVGAGGRAAGAGAGAAPQGDSGGRRRRGFSDPLRRTRNGGGAPGPAGAAFPPTGALPGRRGRRFHRRGCFRDGGGGGSTAGGAAGKAGARFHRRGCFRECGGGGSTDGGAAGNAGAAVPPTGALPGMRGRRFHRRGCFRECGGGGSTDGGAPGTTGAAVPPTGVLPGMRGGGSTDGGARPGRRGRRFHRWGRFRDGGGGGSTDGGASGKAGAAVPPTGALPGRRVGFCTVLVDDEHRSRFLPARAELFAAWCGVGLPRSDGLIPAGPPPPRRRVRPRGRAARGGPLAKHPCAGRFRALVAPHPTPRRPSPGRWYGAPLMPGHELSASDCRKIVHPESLRVPAGEDVAPLSGVASQERALAALAFGLDIRQPRFHVVVVGASGTGRTFCARSVAQAHRRRAPHARTTCSSSRTRAGRASRACSRSPPGRGGPSSTRWRSSTPSWSTGCAG